MNTPIGQKTAGYQGINQGNGQRSRSNSPSRTREGKPPLSPTRSPNGSMTTPPVPTGLASNQSTPGAFTPGQGHFKPSYLESLQAQFLDSPNNLKPSSLNSDQKRAATEAVSPYITMTNSHTGLTPTIEYITNLNSDIARLLLRIESLTNDLASKENNFKYLNDQFDAQTAELKTANESLQETTDKIITYEKDIKAKEDELRLFEEQVASSQREIDVLTENLKDKSTKNELSEEQIEDLKNTLKTREASLEELNRSAQTTKSQTQKLHIILQLSQGKIEKYRSNINGLESKISEKLKLEEDLIKTRKQLEKANSEISDLQKQNQRITQKADMLNSMISSSATRLNMDEEVGGSSSSSAAANELKSDSKTMPTSLNEHQSAAKLPKEQTASGQAVNIQQQVLQEQDKAQNDIQEARRQSITPKKDDSKKNVKKKREKREEA